MSKEKNIGFVQQRMSQGVVEAAVGMTKSVVSEKEFRIGNILRQMSQRVTTDLNNRFVYQIDRRNPTVFYPESKRRLLQDTRLLSVPEILIIRKLISLTSAFNTIIERLKSGQKSFSSLSSECFRTTSYTLFAARSIQKYSDGTVIFCEGTM